MDQAKGRRVTKAIYGRVALVRLRCPRCRRVALVAGGRFVCCGLKHELQEGDHVKLRRMCEGTPIRKTPSRKAKRAILQYQNDQCIYCGIDLGAVKVEWDHFICFAFSYHNGADNFVAACRECNRIKGSLLFGDIRAARDYIRYQRVRRDLPNFPYLGQEYEIEAPKDTKGTVRKADNTSPEAFATDEHTSVGGTG
jgi:5-methylcytosine-specific restriction endonuclease McrA